MKIAVHTPDAPDITIFLPNAILFSPTLLNELLKFSKRSNRSIPDIPPEAVKSACHAIKNYTRNHGPWELVHAETAEGNIVTITV